MTRFGVWLVCAACTSSGDRSAVQPSPGSAAIPPHAVPATPPPRVAPTVAPATADAGSDVPGTHLDDDAVPKPPAHTPPAAHSPAHPIGITLRTTPSGARVTIDGEPAGVTPTFWAGDADGHTHTFAFVYDGRDSDGQRFAVSYYEFVPVTSGIIDVKLEPLVATAPD